MEYTRLLISFICSYWWYGNKAKVFTIYMKRKWTAKTKKIKNMKKYNKIEIKKKVIKKCIVFSELCIHDLPILFIISVAFVGLDWVWDLKDMDECDCSSTSYNPSVIWQSSNSRVFFGRLRLLNEYVEDPIILIWRTAVGQTQRYSINWIGVAIEYPNKLIIDITWEPGRIKTSQLK